MTALEKDLSKLQYGTWEASIPDGPTVYSTNRQAVLSEAMKLATSDQQVTYRQIDGDGEPVPEIVTPFLE